MINKQTVHTISARQHCNSSKQRHDYERIKVWYQYNFNWAFSRYWNTNSMKNWVLHLYTTIWSPNSKSNKVSLESYDIRKRVTLQSHNTCMTDLTYRNRLYVYNLALTTLDDQSVVIGIEKKEDKWHEKWGLTSLPNMLVYSILICLTVTLWSYDIHMIVTL